MVLRMQPHAQAIAASLLLCGVVCGCATAPMQLPYGGYNSSETRWLGPPRQELLNSDTLGQAFVDASLPCQPPIVTARAHVRGTHGRRLIDSSLWVGVDAGTGRLRLESVDGGKRRFGLLARYSSGSDRDDDDATLVLQSRSWVLRARSRELIELLLGVPLSALDIQSLLMGCPVGSGTLRYDVFDDRTIKMVIGDDTVLEAFMRRRSVASPWTVFATVGGVPGRPIRWRADPGRRSGGVLESVRLTSLEWNGTTGRLFDLTFSLDRIQTPATAPDTFSLPIPDSAEEFPVDAVGLNVSVPLLAD
jgi:hypothetical protein